MLTLYFMFAILDYKILSVLGSCGNVYESESGSFTVTTSLNTWNVDSCTVSINVTEGKVALVRFKTITIEKDSTCSNDYIEVRDGHDGNAELIRRYCETESFTVAATANEMFLRIVNTGGAADVYFSAEYFAYDPNDMIRNMSAGYISSPRFQGPSSLVYANNFHCLIKISVPRNFGVILKFTEFELESEQSGKCLDYIEISDNDGHPLGLYCGRDIPRDLVSHTSTVYIKFVTNTMLTYGGFYLSWSTCGGLYTGRIGNLESPESSGKYLDNMHCDYIIRQPVGKRIVITFTFFSMENPYSDKCVDYVQLIDAGSGRMDPIVQHCGQKSVPFSVASETHEMILRFVTDSKGVGFGFKATYEAVDECDHVSREISGTISSPLYQGDKYANNEHCEFEVNSLPGSRILLAFEKFKMEEKYDDDCVDYVELVDSSLQYGEHIHFCGAIKPLSRMLSGSGFKTRFISDDTIDNIGFMAHWAACGGQLGHHFGELKSPEKYIDFGWIVKCSYSLQAPEAKSYFVQISSTGTKPSACTNSLEIAEEVGNGNKTRISLPCTDNQNQFILSQSSKLFITFDMSIARSQSMYFSLRWTACGSKITEPMGYIQSPGWPGYYPVTSSCSYLIEAAVGGNIHLDFSTIGLTIVDTCNDFIEVFDGGNEYAPLLKKITGTGIPPTVVSKSNKMYVKFVQTCNQSSKGFFAKYTVCGVTYTDEKGEITSPNHPRKYTRGITCGYKIKQKEGQSIRMMFYNFDVGKLDNGECSNDYVEIREGLTLQSPVIGQYCGQLDDFTIDSVSNAVLVTIVSASSADVEYKGFRMKYKTLVAEGTLESTTELQRNFTVIYGGLSADQQTLLDNDVAIISTLAIVVVILIIVISGMVAYSRYQRPPLIIPEQKVVVKPSREVLNYRENTHLIDIYNKVGEPASGNSPTLQQQIREQTQRRRSTGSHVQRDLYAQPQKRNGSSSIKEDDEMYFEHSDGNYDHLNQVKLQKLDSVPKNENDSVNDDPSSNYAKVDKSSKQNDQALKTFKQKRGFTNDSYENSEPTNGKRPQDMMYL